MHPKKILMKLTDRFWHYFFLNPVAWFLLLLLIVAVYANYKLNRQLDTVCDWIKSLNEFIDRPNNAYAKAQNICGDRREWPIASYCQGFRNSSGSLAMFAAIRRALVLAGRNKWRLRS